MNRTLALTATLACAVLAACATPSGPTAMADLKPTAGNTAAGTVRFVQSGGKVMVSGEVRGLKPGTPHGFHVHEKGDCSSPDGMSTGGHFNPDAKPHGRHGASPHHVGDLPALMPDGTGVARFSFESDSIAVGAGASNIVGRGLIVHKDPDDYRTQPTGNAGARIACAVITRT